MIFFYYYDFNDLDTLQHEFDCLFINFKKFMLKYKDFKKTITSLNFELENAKNEYEIVIGNKKKLISGAKRLSKDK